MGVLNVTNYNIFLSPQILFETADISYTNSYNVLQSGSYKANCSIKRKHCTEIGFAKRKGIIIKSLNMQEKMDILMQISLDKIINPFRKILEGKVIVLLCMISIMIGKERIGDQKQYQFYSSIKH